MGVVLSRPENRDPSSQGDPTVRTDRRALSSILILAPLAFAATSCGRGGEGPGGTPRVAVIQMLSGNDQEAAAGAQLPNPLMVEVFDARGNPLGGSRMVTAEQNFGSASRISVIELRQTVLPLDRGGLPV